MPHTPRRVTAQQMRRRQQAVQLRLDGASYGQIAEQLGWRSHSSAFDAVQAGLADAVREPAQALIDLELSRLDQLHAACWPKALAGDLRAVDRCLAIMSRRSRLLGLDAPSTVAVQHEPYDELEDLDAAAYRWAAQLAASGELSARDPDA